jgi:hypothetical protein
MSSEIYLQSIEELESRRITDRLTALWALNEAGLGGVLHAVKSPFTGLLVGGMAVILIALIAYFADKKTTTVLKSTILVLIVKAAASPHSPLPAYLAVGFQGLTGAFVFTMLRSHRLAALLLGIAALCESALQKIITLTLIYGNSLWESIDLFFNYILHEFGFLKQPENVRISMVLIFLYFALYLLAGIFIGYLAGLLPSELKRMHHQLDLTVTGQLAEYDQNAKAVSPIPRPFWRKKIFKIGLVLLVMVTIFSLIPHESSGVSRALYVLLRSCTVILIWYVLAAPLINRLIHTFLSKERIKYAAEVEHILFLIPHLRRATLILWKHSARFKYLERLKYFLLTWIYYALIHQPESARIKAE